MDLHHLLLAGLPAHSGLPLKADVALCRRHVSNVPYADVRKLGQELSRVLCFRGQVAALRFRKHQRGENDEAIGDHRKKMPIDWPSGTVALSRPTNVGFNAAIPRP